MVDFYTFEVGLGRVLVHCGQFRLYIGWYPVYTNVVNFYTFEGDLYNCDWFLYIWGKLYTFVEFYTFEGPTDNMTPKYLLPINWIDVLTIQLLFNFTLKLPAHTFDKQSFSLFSPSLGHENISLKYVRIRGSLRLRSKPNLYLSVEQACSLLNGSTYHRIIEASEQLHLVIFSGPR